MESILYRAFFERGKRLMSKSSALIIQTHLLLGQRISPQALLKSTLAQLPAHLSSFNNIHQTFYVGNPNEFSQVYAMFTQEKIPINCIYQGRIGGLSALDLAAEYVQQHKDAMVAVIGFSYRLPTKNTGFIFNEQDDAQFMPTEPLMVEGLAKSHNITRQEQDLWALTAYQKYHVSLEMQTFQEQIYYGSVKQKTILNKISLAHLNQLKPCFKKTGSLTSGNSASFYDHACCLLIAGENFVQQHNVTPLGSWLGTNPIHLSELPMDLGVVRDMLRRDRSICDIQWIELDESYAALACLAARSFPSEEHAKINPIGGALVWGDGGVCNGLVGVSHALWGIKRRGFGDSCALINAMDGNGQGVLGAMKVYSQGGQA